MIEAQPGINSALLSLCALLRSFDHGVLAALSTSSHTDIATLLASDRVVPAEEWPGAYTLRPEIQEEVVARLRPEHPRDELDLHTRAFEYYLPCVGRGGEDGESRYRECICFHHLDTLFFLLLPRLEWLTISRHIKAARAAGPTQTRHLHRLSLYDGYVAVRTQDYGNGEAILSSLLQQPDLERDVRAHALNALAQMHRNLTHYDQALNLYRQLHDLAAATTDDVFRGLALINMSSIYNELEQYEQALTLATQSLRLFRACREPVREAYALYGVGLNAMFLGRWQVAREYFDAAVGLFTSLSVDAGLATLHWSRGFLHHVLGHDAASEAAYTQALQLAQSAEHSEPLLAMDTWLHLGLLHYSHNRWEVAIAAYEKAAALATRLGHEHRLSLISYMRGNVYKAQGRLDESAAAYREAVERIEALREITQGEEIKISLFGTVQQAYEAVVLLCLERDCPHEAFDYVERSRSRAFLDLLLAKAPELSATLDQPVTTLAEVQARLPDGALLVEYFTTGVLPSGEGLVARLPRENARLRASLTLPPHILIFAVTRDHFEVHRATLDPNTLRPHPHDPGSGRRLLHRQHLTLLHERLVAPIAHLLPGCASLYIVPHGPLHYVPFTALRSAEGQSLLDAGGPGIARVPSATVLLRNCLHRPQRQEGDFLALGYNGDGADRLRCAEAEARSLARQMDGEAWTGPDPKSRRLLSVRRRLRGLHIASHAEYKPGAPLDSELRLGRDDALTARSIMDGLDLDAAVVTLSGCMTGLTHVVPGDELLGLQRAFLFSGAPTVICTLWEAADVVAPLVMERFYEGMRQGQAAGAALRDAQVAVRTMRAREVAAIFDRQRAGDEGYDCALEGLPPLALSDPDDRPFSDPFFWAPFMAIGRA